MVLLNDAPLRVEEPLHTVSPPESLVNALDEQASVISQDQEGSTCSDLSGDAALESETSETSAPDESNAASEEEGEVVLVPKKQGKSGGSPSRTTQQMSKHRSIPQQKTKRARAKSVGKSSNEKRANVTVHEAYSRRHSHRLQRKIGSERGREKQRVKRNMATLQPSPLMVSSFFSSILNLSGRNRQIGSEDTNKMSYKMRSLHNTEQGIMAQLRPTQKAAEDLSGLPLHRASGSNSRSVKSAPNLGEGQRHRSSNNTHRRQNKSSIKIRQPSSHTSKSHTSSVSRISASTKTMDRHSRDASRPTRTKSHGEPRKARQIECMTCLDTYPEHKTAHLKCSHDMCHDCLKRLFELSTTDPQHMPPKCCERPIALKHVDALFKLSFKKKWNQKLAEFSTKNRLYCPAKGCGTWIKPEQIKRDDRGRKYGRCGKCDLKVCGKCNHKWHSQRECPQDDAETLAFIKLAKEEGWQECSSCKTMVERTVGCNHMTCRCGYDFCMICNAKWKTCDCLWFTDEALEEAIEADRVRFRPNPMGAAHGQHWEDVEWPPRARPQGGGPRDELEARMQADEHLARIMQDFRMEDEWDFAFPFLGAPGHRVVHHHHHPQRQPPPPPPPPPGRRHVNDYDPADGMGPVRPDNPPRQALHHHHHHRRQAPIPEQLLVPPQAPLPPPHRRASQPSGTRRGLHNTGPSREDRGPEHGDPYIRPGDYMYEPTRHTHARRSASTQARSHRSGGRRLGSWNDE